MLSVCRQGQLVLWYLFTFRSSRPDRLGGAADLQAFVDFKVLEHVTKVMLGFSEESTRVML